MPESYYKPCRELDICNELIEKYYNSQQYEKCFEGHLALAREPPGFHRVLRSAQRLSWAFRGSRCIPL